MLSFICHVLPLAQSKTLQKETSRNQKWSPGSKTEPGFGAALHGCVGDEVVDVIYCLIKLALNGTRAEGCWKPQRSLKPASKHISLFVFLVFTEKQLLQLKVIGGTEKYQNKSINKLSN